MRFGTAHPCDRHKQTRKPNAQTTLRGTSVGTGRIYIRSSDVEQNRNLEMFIYLESKTKILALNPANFCRPDRCRN